MTIRLGRIGANLGSDARFAVRLLTRQPGFTAAAVITLAIAIGASTAISLLLKATFLRPVDIARPERVVELRENSTYPGYRRYTELTNIFQNVAVWATSEVSVGLPSRPDVVNAAFVSGTYFDVLGMAADLGRTLRPEDDRQGLPPVAVISHRLWRTAFAGDAGVLGRTLRVNAREVTIVGVAPEGFHGTVLSVISELWLPVASAGVIRTGAMARLSLYESLDVFWLRVFGRLRDGITYDAADAAIHNLRASMGGPMARVGAGSVVPIRTISIGLENERTLGRFMLLLLGVVTCSLLVACANMANLLIARGLARGREFGIRLAVGASRARVFGQLLTESFVLATLGGAAGLFVARVTLDLLSTFHLPGGISIEARGLQIDRGAMAVALGLTLATGLLFGVVPAIAASRSSAAAALRGAGRSTRRTALRSVLIAAQVAMCLALLAGGGLFYRGVVQALAIDPGLDASRVATGTVDLGLERYRQGAAEQFYDEVAARLTGAPGIQSAAWSTSSPLREGWYLWFEFADRPEKDGATINLHCTSADFFKAVGIPVRKGRGFLETDTAAAPPVAVINETLARRYFAEKDPIGQRLRLGINFRKALDMSDQWVEIVGIAADTRHRGIDQPSAPLVYLPRRQIPQTVALERAVLIVRADDARRALETIRGVVASVDPRVPVRLNTLSALVDRTLMPQRLGLTLLSLFSVVALVISAVGIYGVCSFIVSQRRNEIGIRVALGADGVSILRLVIRQTTIALAGGVAAGLVLVIWSARFVAGFLYGVSPLDPVTLASVTLVLATVALSASLIPARRALAVDPLEVLRTD